MIEENIKDLNKYLDFEKYRFYFLVGQDQFFIKESKLIIINQAIKYKYSEQFNFTIENEKDLNWNQIFSLINEQNLFFKKYIISIIFLKENFCSDIIKKINQILITNNKDVIIILQFYLKKFFSKTFYFGKNKNKCILIHCNILDKKDLKIWLKNKIHKMNFTIKDQDLNIICNHYEGNMVALNQMLKILSFYRKKIVIKDLVCDCSYFNFLSFIDLIILGDLEQSIIMLRKMKIKSIDPMYINQKIKKLILKLILIKENKIKNKYLISLCDRIDSFQLQKIIELIIKIEKEIKNNNNIEIAWMYLDNLILMICGKNFLKV